MYDELGPLPRTRPAESDRALYRAGGVCAFAIGLAYIVIIALYVPMGPPPVGAEAKLAYIARSTAAWWAILWLSVATDLLFVPVAAALYFRLKAIDRNAMLLSAAGVLVFVLLDLAITWTNFAVLLSLSSRYAQAAGNVQRTSLVAAAEYPAAVVESSLLFVYNSLTLAVGILAAGRVMWKGGFGKAAATLGVATGAAGILAVAGSFITPALGITIVLASVLTTVWLFVTGYELYTK